MLGRMRRSQAAIVLILLIEWYTGQCLAWLGEPWSTARARDAVVLLGMQSTREQNFSTRNITDGNSWLPSMGRTVKSIDDASVPMEEGKSWRRAIHHANAIMDMYNDETGRGVSPDLILSTLENVVQLSLDRPDAVKEEFLDDVESLVWRLCDFDLVPSARILNALWEMQLYHRENRAVKAITQVGRQVNLLTHWREWSNSSQIGDRRLLDPPPESYLLDVLQYSLDQNLSITLQLWDLYQSVSDDPSEPCGRSVYTKVLQLLAQSRRDWSTRQCRVCHEMIQQSRTTLVSEPYWPTPDEIKQAMEAAAIYGRSPDAAWLLRTLEACSDVSPDLRQECRTLFIKSLLYSDDPGSLRYMEKLFPWGKWENDTLEQWKMLLQKFVQSTPPCPGVASRVAMVFYTIQNKYKKWGECWRPDYDCLVWFVQASLRDPEKTFQDVVRVTKIVKYSFHTYNLTQSAAHKDFLLFDHLLAAFDQCNSPYAVEAAENFFYVYLTLYEDGRIPYETPDQTHLGRLLRYYTRSLDDDDDDSSLWATRTVHLLDRMAQLFPQDDRVVGWQSLYQNALQCCQGNATAIARVHAFFGDGVDG